MAPSSADDSAASTKQSPRERAGARVTITRMLGDPQVGLSFAIRGRSAPDAEVTLLARVPGRKGWRRMGQATAVRWGGPAPRGRYDILVTPPRKGRYVFKAVVGATSSPKLVTQVQPRRRGSFASLSGWAPRRQGVSDASVKASPDLSAVVFGLAGGTYAENVTSWWVWSAATGRADALTLPEGASACDVTNGGRHVLYNWYDGDRVHHVVLDRSAGTSIDVPAPSGEFDDACGSLDATGTKVALSYYTEAGFDEKRIGLWEVGMPAPSPLPLPVPLSSQSDAYWPVIADDGSSIVYVGGQPDGPHQSFLAVWERATGATRLLTPPGSWVSSVASSPSNEHVAWVAGLDDGMDLLHLAHVATTTDKVIQSTTTPWPFDSTLEAVGVSSDGSRVLYEDFANYGDRVSTLYDTAQGRSVALVRYTSRSWTEPRALSGDGRTILYSGIMPLVPDEGDGFRRDAYLWRFQ